MSKACQEDDLDDLTTRSRALACHVALLRELCASNAAFGPLAPLMKTVTTTIVEALYGDSALLLKLPPGDASAFHVKPNFVALEDAKATIREREAANEAMRAAMRAAQENEAEAKRRLHGEGPTSEQTAAIIGKLEYDLHTCRGECDELRATLHTVKMEMSREYLALEGEVQRWKGIAHDAQRESEGLHRDKVEREQIRRAFADLQTQTNASRAAMEASKRDEVDRAQDPEAAKLEDQLLVLQNARVKEYEETRRRTPKHLHLKIREEFVNEIKMVQVELDALRTYLGSVESGVAPPPAAAPRYQLPASSGGVPTMPNWDASRPATAATAATGGAAVADRHTTEASQLEAAAGIPPRALVQVSLDGGVSFEPLVGGASVAELGGPPLALPSAATHVRLSPPPPRDEKALDEIQRQLNRAGFYANGNTALPAGYAADERGSSRGGVGLIGKGASDGVSAESAGIEADAAADAAAFDHLNTPLWDRYRSRVADLGPKQRRVPKLPRRLAKEAVMLVIEEVLAARWEQINDPESSSVSDDLAVFFYEWLDRVYVLPETVVLVAFSVLAAVEEFWMVSSTVAMFMKCLEGELDGATWQYTMHFRRLLTTHPMSKTSDFNDFAALLYPQAREDELLSLTSAFAVAVTDAPNAEQVVDFLTGRLLAKDDLRLKRLVKVLKYKDAHHRGAFNRSEWTDMCAKMFPHVNQENAERAFARVAEKMEGVERVPIEQLARAACVLDTAPIMPPAVQEPSHPTLRHNLLK